MFNGRLKGFQIKHEENLLDKVEDGYKDIVFQAPTGSGKTVMMCKFIDDYLIRFPNTVFLWLCPGAGGLETQSQESKEKFVSSINYGDVYDFIKESKPENSVYFINWEKLNRSSNIVLRENEKNDLYSQFRYCHNNCIDIFFIVDEEHKNQDIARDMIRVADPLHVIRVSATPNTVGDAKEEIKDEEVIDAGLICAEISINEGLSEDLENGEVPEDNDLYLIEKADEKRKEIELQYKRMGLSIRPLVLIQFPNGNPEYIDRVKEKLNNMGYSDNSGLITEWFSGDHPENVDEIKKLDGSYAFLLFKQAIATGWDCPRAKILVKLREGGTQDFNIQTIGRIRRMPERKHYDNSLIDNCYIYTFDSKFKKGLTQSIENSFYEYLYKRKRDKYISGNGIKKEILDGFDKFAINQEQVVEVIRDRMIKECDYNKNGKLEKKELKESGYIFGTKVYNKAYEQICRTESELARITNAFNISHEIDLHDDGFIIREAKRKIARAGKLEENISNNVLRIMFAPMEDDNISIFSNDEQEFERKNKVIEDMSLREFDAFLINNVEKICQVFLEANADDYVILQKANIIEKDWNIPENQYYKKHRLISSNKELKKNVFEGYGDNILVKPNRSYSEIVFENWCENNDAVEWIYKNGDKGDSYFSIVYKMSFSRGNFYPDYIIKLKNGQIWIIEAKGGVTENGDSNNIDQYAKQKFNALKEYAKKHSSIKWGFTRAVGQHLYFSNTEWDENINNHEIWKDIDEIVK